MLKLLVLACLLLCALGVGKNRLCPCVPCETREGGNALEIRAWKKHAGEITNGTRARSAGIGRGNPGPAEEEIEDDPPRPVAVELSNADHLGIERHFSMDMSELVANNTVCATGMEAVMKSVHHRYNKHLPEDIHVPTSWYMARKQACHGKEPKWFTRDFCPECDHLFEIDPSDKDCPRCADLDA
jgi:hypothetical protein